MARIDLLLLLAFGTLFVAGSTAAVLGFRQALRVSGQKDGDLKMFFWAFGSMIGLIVAGVSAAYFLLPIILHY